MKPTTKSTEGTSYQGISIVCTLDSLIEVVGEPIVTEDGNVIWDCETEDGDVFTIYNLDEEDLEQEMIFRIGSFKKSVAIQAKEEIESLF